jgi:aerobic carbon-monoxide dehydrogenase small subunit
VSTHTITMTINGQQRREQVEARTTLADFLREQLDLTATHLGCEHGVCGACTILIDGESARSCTTLAVQADGAEITTLEGLVAPDDELHPVQLAFWEKHGMQCGFCTPGIVLSVVELLDRNPDPSHEEVMETLGGHLCRCTGYTKIREAVDEAARSIAGSAAGAGMEAGR